MKKKETTTKNNDKTRWYGCAFWGTGVTTPGAVLEWGSRPALQPRTWPPLFRHRGLPTFPFLARIPAEANRVRKDGKDGGERKGKGKARVATAAALVGRTAGGKGDVLPNSASLYDAAKRQFLRVGRFGKLNFLRTTFVDF